MGRSRARSPPPARDYPKPMLLNRAEKALMNNPVRAWIQRRVEAPLLLRLGGRCDGLRALEIGCGRGVGAEIALRTFHVGELVATDIDADMLRLARARLGDRAEVREASADALPFPDASFDVVFDFGIVHHVPRWRDAVAEVARVLRPGGRFYFEEVTRQCLDRPLVRALFEHPREDRFSAEEWLAELDRAGLDVGDRHRELALGDFVVGVGARR